jgi:hypothetical protein
MYESVVDRIASMPIRVRIFVVMPIWIRNGIETMPIHMRVLKAGT